MMSVSTIAKLFQAAEIAAPLELCGLLFSEGRFQTCKNVSVDPWGKFEIDHAEFLQHMADYGEAPWGIVHSHPRGSAHLSGDDCRLLDAMQVTHVQMLMVIVGLQPQEVRVFTKQDDAYVHVCGHVAPYAQEIREAIILEAYDRSFQ